MRETGRRVWCTLGLVALLWSGVAHAQFTPAARAGLTSIDYVLLDRELTLDADIVEIGGRLQTVQIDVGLFSSSITGLAFTLGYGVADVVELWAEPVLLLDPQTELGLNLGASIRAVNTDSFDMAPSIAVPINVTGPGDTVSYMLLGLDSRIQLGSVVSLFLLHGLVEPIFAGSGNVLIQANLGVGLQPVEILGLRLETRPLALETADGDVLHYGDVVPFSFDVLVAPGPIDCFLGLAFPDLGNAGDFYVLTLGAMGRI